tara:strand:- start:8582 stop:9025 length:444 start_codon:yes stop_codon:yes gene_type:complete
MASPANNGNNCEELPRREFAARWLVAVELTAVVSAIDWARRAPLRIATPRNLPTLPRLRAVLVKFSLVSSNCGTSLLFHASLPLPWALALSAAVQLQATTAGSLTSLDLQHYQYFHHCPIFRSSSRTLIRVARGAPHHCASALSLLD